MKRLLATMCCATLLIGCGSAPGTVSNTPSVEKQETIVESEEADDGYKNIVIGGFDARVPDDWVDNDGIFYPIEDGCYPYIYYGLMSDYENLDALFSDGVSTKDLVDVYGDRFDTVLRSEDMHRETYGSNTGLNFAIGGSIGDLTVAELVTLFSNPGPLCRPRCSIRLVPAVNRRLERSGTGKKVFIFHALLSLRFDRTVAV